MYRYDINFIAPILIFLAVILFSIFMPLSQVKTDELGIDDNYGTYYGYDETNQVDNRTQNKE